MKKEFFFKRKLESERKKKREDERRKLSATTICKLVVVVVGVSFSVVNGLVRVLASLLDDDDDDGDNDDNDDEGDDGDSDPEDPVVASALSVGAIRGVRKGGSSLVGVGEGNDRGDLVGLEALVFSEGGVVDSVGDGEVERGFSGGQVFGRCSREKGERNDVSSFVGGDVVDGDNDWAIKVVDKVDNDGVTGRLDNRIGGELEHCLYGADGVSDVSLNNLSWGKGSDVVAFGRRSVNCKVISVGSDSRKGVDTVG